MLFSDIIMIKYTTFINTQITSSNKKPQMHPTGISLYFTFDIFDTISFIHSISLLYCIVSIYLYSASCSAHQSEALPVRETQREESSLERTKRGTWLTS